MTIDRNKQVIQRLFGEVFNQKSLSAIIELYDPDVVDHSAFPDQESGINGIKSAIQGFFELFDNLNVTVKDIIAEGDKVATRETWKGIYKPTGEPAEGSVIHIFRVREGKISDEWSKGWEWIEEL